jgi:DNA-binding NarL/FixJ family response regulator
MTIHVLLVDADPGAAQVTGAIVQRSAPEATLRIEPTALSGWASAQQTRPDVLIVDPAGHSQAGLRLIQHCKELWPALRVIVLASAPTPGLRERVRRLGVELYLEKPAALALLSDSLKAALRGAEIGPHRAPLAGD